MPLLKITTNKPVDENTQKLFLKNTSSKIAEILQKPERFVMTLFEKSVIMTFGGTDEETAYLEIKSIGLTKEQAAQLAGEIPEMVKDQLDIDPSRIYIEFADAPRFFWGWNKGTF